MTQPNPKPDKQVVGEQVIIHSWTTKPPQSPGLYWAWDGYEVEAVRVVLDERGRLGVREYPEIVEPLQQYGDQWIGPLPVPDPPVGQGNR